MLAKAPQRGADEVIIDLEDAVATSAKDEARDTVVAALQEPQYEGVRTAVRVNAPRTPWCHADVIAMASLAQGPDSIIVPKVESARRPGVRRPAARRRRGRGGRPAARRCGCRR